MAASPSQRAPLASLPNEKSARLKVSFDRQDISEEEWDKFEEDLHMAKGYHKRALSENRDSEGDEDEVLAKKTRVHIDSSNEQTDLLSLSSSHLRMLSHLSSGSNLNKQVRSLDPPSPSSVHSRTASTSSQATSTSESSSQGVHFISDARVSSESGDLHAFQNTTLSEGGQFDSSQNTVRTEGELNASQSTAVTEPEEGFYFPVVAATTGTTRFLSPTEAEKREKIRELTHKLRVKLIYAKYKVDTHQVHIPFNELEIRYVAPPKIGKSCIKSREITDFAIAKWDRDRIMLETRELANTRLPIAPKGLQVELRDFSFKPSTPEKANAPLRPMSPTSRLHDLGFDTEASSDSEDELLPRKATPYNYWASRGNPAKEFDPDVDACDGLLSLSRGMD